MSVPNPMVCTILISVLILFSRKHKRGISRFVVCRKRDSKLKQLFSTRRSGKRVILAMKKNVDLTGI